MNKLKLYADFAGPFTLLPPALGVLSGAVTAWGAAGAHVTIAVPRGVLLKLAGWSTVKTVMGWPTSSDPSPGARQPDGSGCPGTRGSRSGCCVAAGA